MSRYLRGEALGWEMEVEKQGDQSYTGTGDFIISPSRRIAELQAEDSLWVRCQLEGHRSLSLMSWQRFKCPRTSIQLA